MNQDNMNIIAMRYVISIPIHLLFVSLCRKIIHHSRAREMIKLAITMYIYESDIYIIYQRTTIANQISQNFNICLVIFAELLAVSL